MSISIEVILALPQRQQRVMLDLPNDCTVLDAVRASGLVARLPLGKSGQLGVWCKLVLPETRLRERDRVEIYRPLLADPKEVRRERAGKNSKK